MVRPEGVKSLLSGAGDKPRRKGIFITTLGVRPFVEPVETGSRRNQDHHIGSLGNVDERRGMDLSVAAYNLDPELVTHSLLAVGSCLPLGERLLPTGALVITYLALDHIFIGRKAADRTPVPHRRTFEVEFHHRLACGQVDNHDPVRVGDEDFP